MNEEETGRAAEVEVCAGAAVIALFARRDRWTTLAVFAIIGVVVDGYAALVILDGVPLWFRFAFVGIVPVAVIIGGVVPEMLTSGTIARDR